MKNKKHNYQKTKLYGSLTTKEIRRNIHLHQKEGWRQAAREEGLDAWSTQVGKVVTPGPGELVAGKWAVQHLHADKLGGTTGEQVTLCNPGFQCGKIKPQYH